MTRCRLDGLHGLQALKALIAARNRILSLDGMSPKKNPLLETVVLSHNRLETVSLAGQGGWIYPSFWRRRASSFLQVCVAHCAGFKHLKKLSLANNRLHAFPRLQKLPALAELRLNGNQITIIPSLATRWRVLIVCQESSMILKCIAVRVQYLLALIGKTLK